MSLEDDILIERFLKKELSLSEEKNFTKRVHSNTSFKEKVSLEKQLFESLDDTNWNFIENTNSKEIQEYKTLFKSKETKSIKDAIQNASVSFREKQSRSYKWFWFSSAAVIALLFSVYIFNFKTFSSDELYNEYSNSTELPSIVDRSELKKKNLLLAQNYFENKEYEIFLSLFKTIKEPTATLIIYKGITETKLGKFKDAESTFIKLINSDFLDAKKGKWFLSLLYLKENKLQKSKEVLSQIIKEKAFNYKKAQKLIKKIPVK